MNYRDSQIEQYIRGRMSGKGAEEFERKMAADPALRRSVQVERAITETIRRDGMTIASGVSATIPAALAAKVSATPAAAGLGIGTGGGVAGAIFGTKIGLTILTAVGIIGVVLGVVLIGPLFDDTSEKNAKGLDVQRIEGVAPAEASGGKDSAAATSESGTSSQLSDPSINSVKGEGTSDDSPREDKGSAREGADKNPARDAQGTGSADTTRRSPSQEMLEQLRREENSRETPTVKKGSAEVQVEIE